MLTLQTSLLDIHGVGTRFFPKLKKLGLYTVRDLLYHFPLRYEDYSRIYSIAELVPDQFATVEATVEEINARRSWRRSLSIVEATVSDETGALNVVWFNQPYLRTSLSEGRCYRFSGKVTLSDEGELSLAHPSYEPAEKISKHTGRLVPIYPETKGLTSRGLRFLVQPILGKLHLKDWLPYPTLARTGFPDLMAALREIHFPTTLDEAERARERFAFEDLFLLQLVNAREKASLAKVLAPEIATDIEWLKRVLTGLPFVLTESQKKSLWEVIKNMRYAHPMNRLLQGDVGSGKTAVAALAALISAKAGYQTAFMAPTEVLVRQHYETLKKLFRGVEAKFQPTLALLTGSEAKIFYENDLESDTSKKALVGQIARGEIMIVVGTHALISKKGATFQNLGFAIVDEQHRFGVSQRKALLSSGNENNGKRSLMPHFLSMSATPIPRTLMLTVFGDLDISLITELPAGRKSIITKVIPPHERAKTYGFIKKKVREGRQVFVICPRIEKTENQEPRIMNYAETQKTETKSVKEEYEKLSKEIFPDLRVGMLHGQLKAKEKELVMRKFKEDTLDVLVSTSVIEVGVDVPNAAIMVIEGAERFGLAQLYQFRGRVGRSNHQSYCFLFTDSESDSTKARLSAILKAKNGFELAEYDLQLRGPGQFFGEEQTGLPDIAMQSLSNPMLVKSSRDAAQDILARDPQLARHASVRERLELFAAKLHRE